MTTLLKQALQLIEAQKAWIMAVPDSTPLPAMPGFDRDWANEVEARIREALAQPKSDREAQVVLLRDIAADINDGRQVWVTATLITSVANMLEADMQCTHCKVIADDNNAHIQRAYRAEAMLAQREHITNGLTCWCVPEVDYTDPDTGLSVIVHKAPQ